MLSRDAVTGRIVTAAFAEEHPDTTVTEAVPDSQHSNEVWDAIGEHIDAAAALLADLQRSKGI